MKKRWQIAAFAAGVLAVTCIFAVVSGGLGTALRSRSAYEGNGTYMMQSKAAAPAETMAAGASMDYAEAPYAMKEMEYGMNAMVESADYEEQAAQSVMTIDAGATQKYAAKLIRTVNIGIETANYDALVKAVREKTEAVGGYIENSSEYSNYNSRRSGFITVRVPQDKLDEFLNTALTDGTVTSRSENVEDITLTYSDIEARVKTLKVEQERLMELLGKADNIESIIALESRLSEISCQLEEHASRLRVYDNMVSYSTVYIDLQEVLIEEPEAKEGMIEKITAGITENAYEITSFVGAILYLLVINIPTMIVVAIAGGVLVLIGKKIYKTIKKKKAAKQTE